MDQTKQISAVDIDDGLQMHTILIETEI